MSAVELMIPISIFAVVAVIVTGVFGIGYPTDICLTLLISIPIIWWAA